MQLWVLLVANPVSQVRIGDEVLDSSWMSELQVLLLVHLNLLLAIHVINKLELWAPVSLILNIEELAW
jgi:hypothetical protein